MGGQALESLEVRILLAPQLLVPSSQVGVQNGGNGTLGADIPQVSSFSYGYANQGTYPSDNAMAVGPRYVVTATNDGVAYYTKAGGAAVQQMTLPTFFGDSGSLNNYVGVFDPRVIYDSTDGRFIVTADEASSSASDEWARILVMVSNTSDPTQGWTFNAFSSLLNYPLGNGQYTAAWSDFPSVGDDANNLYVTANYFSYSSGAYVGSAAFAYTKAALYNTTGSTPTEFNLTNGATFQPTIPVGDQTGLGGAAIFTSFATNEIVVDVIPNPTVSNSAIDAFYIAFSGDSGVSVLADQPGAAATVATNDNRISSPPVWENNVLYFANTIVPPAGQARAGVPTVHWYEISTQTYTLIHDGNVTAADLGAQTNSTIDTFMPAVGVDRFGNLAISFSASSLNLYLGSFYTTINVLDSTFTPESTGVLSYGQNVYSDGSGTPRWGDYSTVALDPDQLRFWSYNSYSEYVPGSYAWATSFGTFSEAVNAVYRLYANYADPALNIYAGMHVFTISQSDWRNYRSETVMVNGQLEFVWNDESYAPIYADGQSPLFSTMTGPYVSGASVVYRLQNPNTGEIYLTMDQAEDQSLIADGWNSLTSMGYMLPYPAGGAPPYPATSSVPGFSTVWHFYDPAIPGGDRVFTRRVAEANSIRAAETPGGWQEDTPLGFALPSVLADMAATYLTG